MCKRENGQLMGLKDREDTSLFCYLMFRTRCNVIVIKRKCLIKTNHTCAASNEDNKSPILRETALAMDQQLTGYGREIYSHPFIVRREYPYPVEANKLAFYVLQFFPVSARPILTRLGGRIFIKPLYMATITKLLYVLHVYSDQNSPSDYE